MSAGVSNSKAATFGYLAITCLVLLIAVYACLLQHIFYKHNGPFYDSLSYYNHLDWIMTLARHGRLAQAFQVAITNSTIFLPWLQA
ncbi:MAG TPA: hypothetical protein V6C72_03635, partial [Chroococcales cyanobacterium]